VVLFRIFHYPAPDPIDRPDPPDPRGRPDLPDPPTGSWGVAEHTDYGLLTLLHQDASGGLEGRGPDGWVAVPPERGALVGNIGDMLANRSGGRYRSTPHRVHAPVAAGRISAPLFVDPSWDAHVPGIPGTYGEHLTAKVARVFPHLAASPPSPPH
jgi:isopenicillin N synthase-like dioxygenase